MALGITLEYNPSAFRHGCTEDDINKAFETFCYDGDIVPEEGVEDKYLLIGLDINANLIEVMYNVIDENTVNVFHAMKCRKIYIPLVGKGG
ncbi:MAG: hypothetical protein LBN36_01975 [Clostridiales Family XIII bacterium]|jgi:hypothetical protein|nr:hypothetical protein [Clostridiales Family XIII bacterium]